MLARATRILPKARYFSAAEKTNQYYIDLEWDYGCHNYGPVPVVLSKGLGSHVWDVEGIG